MSALAPTCNNFPQSAFHAENLIADGEHPVLIDLEALFFSHLGVLWSDPRFFLEAEEIVKLLQTRIEKDGRFDMIAGSAGCIASLLSLYSVMPSSQTLILRQEYSMTGTIGK